MYNNMVTQQLEKVKLILNNYKIIIISIKIQPLVLKLNHLEKINFNNKVNA